MNTSALKYLELGSLVEVSSADALPDDVPVGAAGDQVHPLLHHDVFELRAHFTHLRHTTRRDNSSVVPE